MKKQNTIPLATAKKWAKEWRDDQASYNKYFELRAFNIPEDDLKDVLKDPGVKSIRAYIGVEKTTAGGKNTFEEKLMIVGVDKNNNDIISRNGNSLIFDFSHPCPSACDPKSPLNG